MFVDKVKVSIKAGDGGNGAVSFRHEKFIDKGGPDGGDGGRGGNVILIGSNRTNTLANFRYQKELLAKNGSPGSKRKKHGKSAEDLKVDVPVGTAIYNEADQLIGDILSEKQEVIVAYGGRGGFGNAHFVSSRRQAPRVAEKGEPGQELSVDLELKLIADVGLIGLPNAGKSTLLSRITNATPEIANYPFTTIKPNLGVAKIDENTSVLVADIPGLIEGASEGKGLGDEFLRHVERTKVLVHLIDAYSENVAGDYKIIRNELENYKIDLSKRPEIIVLTKIEGLDNEIVKDQINKLNTSLTKKAKLMAISSSSGQGLKELLYEVNKAVDKANQQASKKQIVPEAMEVISLPTTANRWEIKKQNDYYLITGRKIERFASQTDFDNFAGVDRLRDIMRKMGIMHELERQAIEPDNKVFFGQNCAFGPLLY